MYDERRPILMPLAQ